MNSVAINIVFITIIRFIIKKFLDKITIVINLIIRIFMYSAIKIKANDPALYSTLNPDTSSDSPSAKSNGVRLVSAKLVINQMYLSGIIINRSHEYIFKFIKCKSIVFCTTKIESKVKDIDTS